MEKIVLAIKEIRDVLSQIAVAESFLDSLLFFLATYIVCLVLTIDWKFAFILGMLFFVWRC